MRRPYNGTWEVEHRPHYKRFAGRPHRDLRACRNTFTFVLQNTTLFAGLFDTMHYNAVRHHEVLTQDDEALNASLNGKKRRVIGASARPIKYN